MKEEKIFYVCLYGGSGSYMMTCALEKYGKVYHIHSRYPPDKLEYIGNDNGGNCYHEWFNGIPIPDKELHKYYVIYIYRNPCHAIISRFINPVHLTHIQCSPNIKLQDIYDTQTDLYGIEEFYDNYTKQNKNRNYKIYSVKFEEIFDKQDELSKLLGVGKLNVTNTSSRTNIDNRLKNIYENLINKMNSNSCIMIN